MVSGKVVVWWWQWLVKLVVTGFVRFRSLMSRKCIAWQRGQRQRDRGPKVQIGVGFLKQQLRPENQRVLLTHFL